MRHLRDQGLRVAQQQTTQSAGTLEGTHQASPEIRVGCLGARRGGFTLNRGSYWWAASLSHSPMAAAPAAGGIGPEAPPFLAIRKVRVRSRRRDRRHTQPQLVQLFLLMTAPAVSDLPTQNSGEPHFADRAAEMPKALGAAFGHWRAPLHGGRVRVASIRHRGSCGVRRYTLGSGVPSCANNCRSTSSRNSRQCPLATYIIA